jgi:outer membrane protein OmpA-like peptidoglycan-associated protein
MSKKFKLFASVAVPLVSLPLVIQPAVAMPAASALQQSQVQGAADASQPTILVQDAPQGEEQLPPRRQKGQDQGQGQGQEGRKPDAADQRDRPARPPKAAQQQAPDAAEQPQQRQQRQQPAAGDEAEQPAKPRRAQPAEQPQDETPAARPERQQPLGQNEKDRPSLPRDRKSQNGSSNDGQPAVNDTRQQSAPQEGGNTPAQRRNAQDRNAAPDQAEGQPRKPGQDRNANPDAAPNAVAPEAPATKGAAGTTRQPESPEGQNRRNQADRNQNGQPDARQPDARQPAPGARPADQAQQPEGQTLQGQPVPGQPQGERPRRLTTEGQQPPAEGQPLRNQAGQPQTEPQPGQPATATTPQQVERARQLAKDPAAAQNGEQVTLPVENGAAVLDSAKRPDGRNRPQRAPDQADQRQFAPPRSDADAQQSTGISREQRQQFRELNEARGERLDRRPDFERPQGWDFDGGRQDGRSRDDGRVIITIDNQPVVRHDDSRRFYDRSGRQPEYDRLGDDRYREVIVRDDGTRIVTIRNRYGEIVQRTRTVRGGQEYVLYEAPELMDEPRGRNYVWRDPGDDLPPMRLTVPLDRYIADTSSEPDRDYYEFLEQPPVEPVERVYSLDEVRYSARIRDKVPRIDLDTITFATGSAEIPMAQASSLRKIADAINKVLQRDPSETFLIEGHTDAVGSDQDNLVLSDQRAESVARVLSDAFNIPPENLTTQGYGEQYLKVRTDGPNQENRRVTIRRITALVKPVASNQ